MGHQATILRPRIMVFRIGIFYPRPFLSCDMAVRDTVGENNFTLSPPT